MKFTQLFGDFTHISFKTIEIMHIHFNFNKRDYQCSHERCFIVTKKVALYALLVYKIFGPKIRSCKFFYKFQVCMMTYLSLKNIHHVRSFWNDELLFTFLFLSILVFSWNHLSGNVLIEISKYFNNGRNVVKYFLTRLILRQSPESAGNSLIRAATAATVCHSAATPFLRPFSRQPHQDDFCF